MLVASHQFFSSALAVSRSIAQLFQAGRVLWNKLPDAVAEALGCDRLGRFDNSVC